MSTTPPGTGRGARTAVRVTYLSIAALVVGFPVYYTLLGSLLPSRDLASGDLLPTGLTLQHFRDALAQVPLGSEYLITIAVTLVQAGAQLVTSVLAAYGLSFREWRGRKVVFWFIVATMAVPAESVIIPNYTTVTGLGLQDTVLGITLPFLAAGYPVFLLRQAFLAFPPEIHDAARLDGCGTVRLLWRMVLPMSVPAVTTAALWSALSAWNGYFWPLLITDSADRRTIQVGLGQLSDADSVDPSVLLAGVTLVLLPTLLLIIAGRRFLVTGFARDRAN